MTVAVHCWNGYKSSYNQVRNERETMNSSESSENDEWGDPEEYKDWTPDESRRLRENHERNTRNFEE